MERARLVKINGITYELHISTSSRGRLCHYESIAASGVNRLAQVIEIPLGEHQLRSLFDYKTAAAIVKLVENSRNSDVTKVRTTVESLIHSSTSNRTGARQVSASPSSIDT